MLRSSSQRAIAMYDRVYRLLHRLDTPESEVGPALRVEVCRCYRQVTLTDGTIVHRGDRIGALHMNNDHVRALHVDGGSAMTVGLALRRAVFASLRALATQAAPGAALADLPAFVAVTILHHGLLRMGFERDRAPLLLPGVVAAYQRALLVALHPAGALRLARLGDRRVERVWISRGRLLSLYGHSRRVARQDLARAPDRVTSTRPATPRAAGSRRRGRP